MNANNAMVWSMSMRCSMNQMRLICSPRRRTILPLCWWSAYQIGDQRLPAEDQQRLFWILLVHFAKEVSQTNLFQVFWSDAYDNLTDVESAFLFLNLPTIFIHLLSLCKYLMNSSWDCKRRYIIWSKHHAYGTSWSLLSRPNSTPPNVYLTYNLWNDTKWFACAERLW